jgi:predicted nucleotidyltransferase
LRISSLTISNIIKGLKELNYLPSNFELYLFGSRADDSKRGGDIDLLLLTDLNEASLKGLKEKRHYLISACKKYIEDQKLDLTILNKNELPTNEFYQAIKSDLVKLNERV